ncbi:hypothetical protein B0H13DRAFT_1863940 [Mycena leptocephala]|nr:hypothetical protein B0H13DRAFT_1863940 [Mycena leptocephala]
MPGMGSCRAPLDARVTASSRKKENHQWDLNRYRRPLESCHKSGGAAHVTTAPFNQSRGQSDSCQNAAEFSLGPRGIKLDALFLAATDRRSYGSAVTHCQECRYTLFGTVGTFGQWRGISEGPE